MEFLDAPITSNKKLIRTQNINSRFFFHSFIRSFQEEAKALIFFL
jgi:hypothetical protein